MGREMFTASGTYLWSFVTQIFHNDQLNHGGDGKAFEVMTLTELIGLLASLLATKKILMGITSSEISHRMRYIYILHMQIVLVCCYI